MALTKVTSGLVNLDGGITIDNITIDGTEIDLSSGDLTLDVAGDIILDADGGDWSFNDGGVTIGSLGNVSSDFRIRSHVSDKDILFVGNDGGSTITAMTIDMSAGGHVGIGETSPDKELHIKNTATGDTGIVIENTNNAQNLDIDFYNNVGSAQGRIRYAEGAGSFNINPNVSGSSPFTILYGGNVGIGATSPATQLHVANTAGIELRLDADTNNNGQEDCFIKFQTDGGTQVGIAGMDNNNSSTLFSGNTENAMVFGTVSNLPTIFATNNTERLKLDADGAQITIKGNATGAQLTMMDSSGNVDGYVYAEGGTTSGEIGFLDADGHWALKIDTDTDTRMFVNDSTKFILNGQGNMYITGGLTENYSDDRLKENKVNLTNALSKVQQLNGFTYTPNAKAQALGFSADKQIGISAQDVEAVLPEAVFLAEALNADHETDYKTVQYQKLVPLLIEAIKELKQEVEELKGG